MYDSLKQDMVQIFTFRNYSKNISLFCNLKAYNLVKMADQTFLY